VKNVLNDIFEKKLSELGRTLLLANSQFEGILKFVGDNNYFSKPNYNTLLHEVCRAFDIGVEKFLAPDRNRDAGDARKSFLFISVNIMYLDVEEMTNAIGRERSTYYNSLTKHFELYDYDEGYKENFDKVISNLNLSYDHEAEKIKKEISDKRNTIKARKNNGKKEGIEKG
jgi:hypothetical protein